MQRVLSALAVATTLFSTPVLLCDESLEVTADASRAGEAPRAVLLEVLPSSPLTIPEDYAGCRIDVLEATRGVGFRRDLPDHGPATIDVPSGRVIVSIARKNEATRWFWRLSLTPGQPVELPAAERFERGYGGLTACFVPPEAPAVPTPDTFAVAFRAAQLDTPPDELIRDSASRYHAFWWRLPSGSGQVLIRSARWIGPRVPSAVVIPDGDVVSLGNQELRDKPNLRIALRLPEGVAPATVEWELLRCGDAGWRPGSANGMGCSHVAGVSLPSSSAAHFLNLDPAEYGVRWQLSGHGRLLRIDLREGISVDEEVDASLFHLHGRVTSGGERVPASLSFEHEVSGSSYKAEADALGEYGLVTSEAGEYRASISLGEGPAYVEDFRADPSNGERDFDVPARRIRVQAYESGTGKRLPGTAVRFLLTANDDQGSPEFAQRGDAGITNPEGEVLLPPLAPGALRLEATKPGYLQKRPALLVSRPGEMTEVVAIELVHTPDATVRIIAPTGTPEIGAVVLGGAAHLFSTPTDETGTTTLSGNIQQGEPIIVMTRDGRLAVFTFSVAEDERTYRMPETGAPLVLSFMTPSGRKVPFETVDYSLDGIPIPRFLSLLAREAGGGGLLSDQEGLLRIGGLPGTGIVSIWGTGTALITAFLPVTEVLTVLVPPRVPNESRSLK